MGRERPGQVAESLEVTGCSVVNAVNPQEMEVSLKNMGTPSYHPFIDGFSMK